MGWFPTEFGLKDHTVFWYDGYYYLASIYLDSQDRFAYARSVDLCNWDDLFPILTEHTLGEWDEMNIWSPYVYEESGFFYMYYTGVTYTMTQSIMLAISENPADPHSWQPQGMIFQPNHSGMIWVKDQWADCRDPMIIKYENQYYLYYTGSDTGGGIIGVATALSPTGPWTDLGSIIPPLPGALAESSTIAQVEGTYYLFYNQTGVGELFRMGTSPTGPWQDPLPFHPGWAHEIWVTPQGDWFTSYLTTPTVTISPLTWDDFYQPAHPWIGTDVFHILLAFLIH